jgi:hypothetical protein
MLGEGLEEDPLSYPQADVQIALCTVAPLFSLVA